MSGSKYLLDTNIVIALLKGNEKLVAFLSDLINQKAKLFVSQITRIELLSFPSLTENETESIKEFLSNIEVVSITEQVENMIIQCRRESKLNLPDAIVIASARENNCILLTADKPMLKTTFVKTLNPLN